MAGGIIEQKFAFVLAAQHRHRQIVPAKAGHEHARLAQAQQADHVLHDLRRSRGCKGRENRTLRKLLDKRRYRQIAGAEIMPPLRDAMRFIHRYTGDRQSRHLQAEPVQLQPLRRDIQQLQLAAARRADPFIYFFAA
ncbi:hypothetical protein D3C73_1273070 [compost metagenome]